MISLVFDDVTCIRWRHLHLKTSPVCEFKNIYPIWFFSIWRGWGRFSWKIFLKIYFPESQFGLRLILVEDRRRMLFAVVAKRIGHLLLLLLWLLLLLLRLLWLLSRWRRLRIVSLGCGGGGFARVWRWVSGGRRVLEVAHGGRALLFHHTIGGQAAAAAAHGIE